MLTEDNLHSYSINAPTLFKSNRRLGKELHRIDDVIGGRNRQFIAKVEKIIPYKASCIKTNRADRPFKLSLDEVMPEFSEAQVFQFKQLLLNSANIESRLMSVFMHNVAYSLRLHYEEETLSIEVDIENRTLAIRDHQVYSKESDCSLLFSFLKGTLEPC